MSREDILGLIPRGSILNIAAVEEYGSRQNVEKGKILVSCGCVRGMTKEKRQSNGTTRISALVEAEKASGKAYKVVFHTRKNTWEVDCTCEARSHQAACKHKCAMCFALIVVRDHFEDAKPPHGFHRKGQKYFAPPRGNSNRQQRARERYQKSEFYKGARVGASWKHITATMIEPLPKQYVTSSGAKRKWNVVEEAPKKRQRVRAHFCYCAKPYEKEGGAMVECTGGSSACHGGWYHIKCIEDNKEEPELERNQRNGVAGEFVCALCRLVKKM